MACAVEWGGVSFAPTRWVETYDSSGTRRPPLREARRAFAQLGRAPLGARDASEALDAASAKPM